MLSFHCLGALKKAKKDSQRGRLGVLPPANTHLLVPDIENDQKPQMSQDSFNQDAGENMLMVGRFSWGALTQSCESGSRGI